MNTTVQNIRTARTAVASLAVLTVLAAGCNDSRPVDPRPNLEVAAEIRKGGGPSDGGGGAVASQYGPDGQGFATVSGRVVLDGPRPTVEKLLINKDAEVCGKHMLLEESLVVDPSGGIKDVVIFLRAPKGVEVPVSDAVQAPAEVLFDNLHCRFEPHVLPIWRTKQKLIIKNSDPVGHNTNCTITGEDGFNTLINPGSQIEYEFKRAQTSPLPAACNIHPWMKGYLMPLDHPYVAVTQPDGSFQIENMPTGKWEFQVWQERFGSPDSPTLKRGRFVLEVKPGENAVPEIRITPSA